MASECGRGCAGLARAVIVLTRGVIVIWLALGCAEGMPGPEPADVGGLADEQLARLGVAELGARVSRAARRQRRGAGGKDQDSGFHAHLPWLHLV